MKLPKVIDSRTLNKVFRTVRIKKPTLYAIGATIGVVGTGVTCAKAAVKTKDFLEECEEDVSFKRKVIYVGGMWIMPVVVGGATIFCIWRCHTIHLKREASLAAFGAYWKKKYDELDKKISEKLGEDVNKEIKDEILKDKMEKKDNLPSNQGLPPGIFWVYDDITDQFFQTSGNQITWALYNANKRFAEGKDVDYNWLINMIGGKMTTVEGIGWSPNDDELIDDMNWNLSFGISNWIDVTPDYHVSSNVFKEGEPIPTLVFSYDPRPLDVWV